MSNKLNLNTIIEEKYGLLTIIKAERKNLYKGKNRNFTTCLCDCGKIKNNIYYYYLKENKDKLLSCGCQKLRSKAHIIHGLRLHKHYLLYKCFNSRCYHKKNQGYNNYGGRGIYVDNLWKEERYGGLPNHQGLHNFLKWCEENPKPSKKYSLDRKENDGPYAPWNCKWSTRKEQLNNRRKKIKNYEHDFIIKQKNEEIAKLKSEILFLKNK